MPVSPALMVMVTRVMPRQMIRKLKRMAASDNNKDYLEQVYYAIGNIYLAQRDTVQAIAAYEEGNKKATRSGIEKGVLLLTLGNLYWEREQFADAQRCYGEAIGLLDQDRKDYKQLSERSEGVGRTGAAHKCRRVAGLVAAIGEDARGRAVEDN